MKFFDIDKGVPVDISRTLPGVEPLGFAHLFNYLVEWFFPNTRMSDLAAKIMEVREFEKVQFIGRVHVQVRMIIQQVLDHGRAGLAQSGNKNRFFHNRVIITPA